MAGRRTRRVHLAAMAAFALGLFAGAAPAQLPRIAIVEQGDPVENMALGGNPRWDAFLRELQALGHIEGQTIVIDRWTATDQSNEGFASLAASVVATRPDLIMTVGLRPIRAFREATTTIPVVGVGSFPQDISLAHPGGNVTHWR